MYNLPNEFNSDGVSEGGSISLKKIYFFMGVDGAGLYFIVFMERERSKVARN